MTYKLVVTFDLSEFGEHVLETALPTAEATQAEVFLLHIVHPAHETAHAERNYDPLSETQAATVMGREHEVRVRELESVAQAAQRQEYEALNYLNKLVPRFGAGKAKAVARTGAQPAREIVNYADQIGADAIVMATHGRTALAHVVLGSVASAVVRSSPIPVILKRPAAMPKHPDDVQPA
jgi:nucleotide-binding universal stress UspA family protein